MFNDFWSWRSVSSIKTCHNYINVWYIFHKIRWLIAGEACKSLHFKGNGASKTACDSFWVIDTVRFNNYLCVSSTVAIINRKLKDLLIRAAPFHCLHMSKHTKYCQGSLWNDRLSTYNWLEGWIGEMEVERNFNQSPCADPLNSITLSLFF